MITAILIMFWLVTCLFCAAAGFLIGKNRKKQNNPALPEPTAEERKRFAREMREMENFFKYDGTEQKDD